MSDDNSVEIPASIWAKLVLSNVEGDSGERWVEVRIEPRDGYPIFLPRRGVADVITRLQRWRDTGKLNPDEVT